MNPDEIDIRINPAVEDQEVCALRNAVGWGGFERDYPAAFTGYWGTVGAFDEDNYLIGWCAILSDGVRHAVLIDVIVHPAWQRRGIGKRIVRQAIDHCHTHGISIIHVDFTPEYSTFYKACGFKIGLAGILNTAEASKGE
jgi:GNAT superfamily N-acetyltransferase